jgi:hypothetical protein
MSLSRDEIVRSLAQRIQEIESAQYLPPPSAVLPGVPALDDLLPEGRVPAGALVELLMTAEGAGAWTLALLLAKQACGERKMLVLADRQKSFYPPAASRLGMDLSRLIVVHPTTYRDHHVAIHQSLSCTAVGAVIGWCDRLPALDFRRLQLAAKKGGGVGLLVRPASALHTPSFAAIRLLVAPLTSPEAPRRIQVDVVRYRGGKPGRSLILEIDDETGHVRVPARVAASTAEPRSARASG